MKFNDIKNSISIRIIFIILLIICLMYTILANISRESEVDFNKIYAQAEYLAYTDEKKVNTKVDNVYFYKPQGYNLRKNDGIFLKSLYATVEIIPNKINVEDINTKYTINPEEDIIFQKGDLESGSEIYKEMIVWDIGDMYEVLLVGKNSNAVVGDIKKGYEYGCVNDMIEILNSIEIK